MFNVDSKLLRAHFFSDKQRITQVLINLVSNAFRYTVEGEIIVRIERPQEEMLHITVENTSKVLSDDYL